MEKETIIVTSTFYHHMPQNGQKTIQRGQTPGQVLKILREDGKDNFGNMGEITIYFSDNSTIDIKLIPAYGGGRLLNSQQIVRTKFNGRKRIYKW